MRLHDTALMFVAQRGLMRARNTLYDTTHAGIPALIFGHAVANLVVHFSVKLNLARLAGAAQYCPAL